MVIRRDGTAYADMGGRPVNTAGSFDPSVPVAGFYRMRFGAGTVAFAIKVWFGPPHDPVTGEELDRSWRWQARADDGELLDMERVWPACAKTPISEADYTARCNRRTWAQSAAPDSAYAARGRKYDSLSASTPLPF